MTPVKRPSKKHCVRCGYLDWVDRAGYCDDCARDDAGLPRLYYWDLEPVQLRLMDAPIGELPLFEGMED